jgi:hypothetical protein
MNQGVGEIPAYLAGPSTSVVPPPVTTRLQQLPYEELAWEDFERLCLRCARTESDVVRVRPYGERGSAQAGIDLYARVANGPEFPEGALPVAQAISTAEEFAINLGFDPPAARKHARQLIESDGAATGLLSSRFGEDVGFFHRSFQEHLAARHLASLPFDRLRAVVANRCRDSGWHEVILATLRFVGRPDEVARLVESLETSPTNLTERHDLQLLLADVGCGDYGAPAALTKRLLAQSIEVIERGEWMPHRERMLTRVLQGLRQGPVRDQVRRKVCQWWPGNRWRADLYAVVSGWGGQFGSEEKSQPSHCASSSPSEHLACD